MGRAASRKSADGSSGRESSLELESDDDQYANAAEGHSRMERRRSGRDDDDRDDDTPGNRRERDDLQEDDTPDKSQDEEPSRKISDAAVKAGSSDPHRYET